MGDVFSLVYNFIYRYLRRSISRFSVGVMYLISRCWMLVIFFICGVASNPVFVFLQVVIGVACRAVVCLGLLVELY
jgi:hypothetical protein